MLPKRMRVHTPIFSSLMKKSEARFSAHFSVRFRRGTAQQSHFSVVVNKKVEKTAVGRNFLRRRTNEALRDLIHKNTPILTGVDSIIFLKKGTETMTFEQIIQELSGLLASVVPR